MASIRRRLSNPLEIKHGGLYSTIRARFVDRVIRPCSPLNTSSSAPSTSILIKCGRTSPKSGINILSRDVVFTRTDPTGRPRVFIDHRLFAPELADWYSVTVSSLSRTATLNRVTHGKVFVLHSRMANVSGLGSNAYTFPCLPTNFAKSLV